MSVCPAVLVPPREAAPAVLSPGASALAGLQNLLQRGPHKAGSHLCPEVTDPAAPPPGGGGERERKTSRVPSKERPLGRTGSALSPSGPSPDAPTPLRHPKVWCGARSWEGGSGNRAASRGRPQAKRTPLGCETMPWGDRGCQRARLTPSQPGFPKSAPSSALGRWDPALPGRGGPRRGVGWRGGSLFSQATGAVPVRIQGVCDRRRPAAGDLAPRPRRNVGPAGGDRHGTAAPCPLRSSWTRARARGHRVAPTPGRPPCAGCRGGAHLPRSSP